jgi:hypothetical protein
MEGQGRDVPLSDGFVGFQARSRGLWSAGRWWVMVDERYDAAVDVQIPLTLTGCSTIRPVLFCDCMPCNYAAIAELRVFLLHLFCRPLVFQRI